MGILSLVWRSSKPAADASSATPVASTMSTPSVPPPPGDTVSPRPRPGRLARLLTDTLRIVLVPVVVVGLPLWPVALVLSVLPVFCVVAFPLLLLDTLLVSYGIAWLVYLALAQTDPPPLAAASDPSHLRSAWLALVNALPVLPYSPVHVFKIALITLQSSTQVVRMFFPAIFDWSYRRVMVLGTQSGSEIVMENIVYSDDRKMLDAYTPPAAPPQGTAGGESFAAPLAPVVVILPTTLPLLPSISGRKAYLQLALRFRRQGYAVVVPDITSYPSGRVSAGIADVRAALAWVASEAASLGVDANRIYLLGHGMSSHLALLTCVQHAVVYSREKFLDQAWEREQEPLRTHDSYDERSSSSPASEAGKHHVLGPSHFPADAFPTSSRPVSDASYGPSGSSSQLDTSLALQDELRQAHFQRRAASASNSDEDDQRWMDENESDFAGSISPGQDMLFGPSGVGHLPPGLASTGRENLAGLGSLDMISGLGMHSAQRSNKYAVPIPSTLAEAEGQIGMGLRSVELYAPNLPVPPVRGLILMAGISDVIKAYRYERERGVEDVSPLRRAMGPSHTKCLLHSPAHLLYAAKNILDLDLLPPKFLLVHGGKDSVVPVEQSTLLRTMLQGIGAEQVVMRAYRNLGHIETLAAGFLGMAKSLTAYRDPILNDLFTFISSDEATPATPTNDDGA